jgi:hypothetical protein
VALARAGTNDLLHAVIGLTRLLAVLFRTSSVPTGATPSKVVAMEVAGAIASLTFDVFDGVVKSKSLKVKNT